MSRYDISVDAASRLLALSHVNDLLSHSQVQHDKLRIELKLQTSKAAARMCEASFWVARLESGWSGQCAGEHSTVSVRPARRGPASGGRECACTGGPGRAVGVLDCVKPIEGIADLDVQGMSRSESDHFSSPSDFTWAIGIELEGREAVSCVAYRRGKTSVEVRPA